MSEHAGGTSGLTLLKKGVEKIQKEIEKENEVIERQSNLWKRSPAGRLEQTQLIIKAQALKSIASSIYQLEIAKQ